MTTNATAGPEESRAGRAPRTLDLELIVNQTDPTAAVWIDGDPLMETLAAAIWEHCETEGTSLVVDDPRNIAAVVAAVVSPPTDRAAWLTEAADIAESLRQFEPTFGARKAAQISENVGILRVAEHLRRLAAEAQQPGVPRCPACGHVICDGDGPCGALLDAWQRCACTGPGAAGAQQQEPTTADKAYALGLTDTEYRARSHVAAVAAVRAAIPGMYATVGFRLEDVLNEAAGAQQQPDTEAPRCDAGFVFGGRCVKPAGHRDPHATAPVAQQPAAELPKLPPMDPVHILGIDADAEQQAAAADDEETRRG